MTKIRLTTTNQAISGRNSLIFSILLTLFCQLASAATYYVATNGSDSNSGASTSPFRTIQRGVDVVGPGDTIIVRDGTYGPPAGSDPNGSMAVNVYSSGTPSAPITLKAERKWGAVLDGQLSCHSLVNFANGSAYWILQDFDITQGYWAGVWGNSNAHHITLKGNHLHHIGNRYETAANGIEGWYSDTASQYITFDGNMFNDIGRVGSGLRVNIDHGIYSHATNVTVINNIFYNLSRGWGIQTANGATNWSIFNNTFAFPNPGRDGHIVLWDTNININIQNNIFFNPSNYAVVTAAFLGSCNIDNNLIYGATGVIDNSTGCSVGSNQIGVNPMLVNTSASPFDFHLQAGSPAIDAALTMSMVTTDFDGTTRPQGAAPDLGSCERVVSISAPVITGVFASGITPNAAFINWTTNVGATSYVQYGLSSYTNTTPQDLTLLTIHSVALSNLTPSTVYHYRVASADSAGRLSYSPDFTFTTAAAPPPPSPSTYYLTAGSPTLSLSPGQSATDLIGAFLTSGNPAALVFTTSPLPAGVTGAFSANCTATCSTTLTISTSTSTLSGTYNIVVTGTGGGTSASVTIALTLGVSVSTQGAPDFSSGMAAWWKFDEGSGTQASDSSGNGNTGSIQIPRKVKSWATGAYGTALSLNGSSSNYVSVNESPSLEMTNQMTVSFWMRASATSNVDPRPIAKLYSWDVKLNGANRFPQFSAAGKYAMTNYSVPLGAWQHVVFTFSSGIPTAYVNGVPVAFAANTFTGAETLPLQTAGLYIGTDTSRTSSYAGLLDDVRIYNRALTAADVLALYSGTLR